MKIDEALFSNTPQLGFVPNGDVSVIEWPV